MTQPHQFTTATPSSEVQRDPNSFIPMARCKGKLLIVRPLKYQQEGFVTIHKPEGTDAVFADIAVLDPILAAENEYGDQLPAFPAGTQFRDQVILQGFLKGTFKRYIGSTLIGTLYFGPREKGKPPMMWQDLSQDGNCIQRGQGFLAAHPEFLVPTSASFNAPQPAAPAGPPAYRPPQDPAGSNGYSSPSYQNPPVQQQYAQPAQATTQWASAPAQQPQHNVQQVQAAYGQDPWAQQQSQARPVSPAPQQPQQAPMTTLEQMRQWQGGQAPSDAPPPF